MNSIIGRGSNNPNLQAKRGNIIVDLSQLDKKGYRDLSITSFDFTTIIHLKKVVKNKQEENDQFFFNVKTGIDQIGFPLQFEHGNLVDGLQDQNLEMMIGIANYLNFAKCMAVERLDFNEDIARPFITKRKSVELFKNGKIEKLLARFDFMSKRANRFLRGNANTPVTISDTYDSHKMSSYEICAILNIRWEQYKIQKRKVKPISPYEETTGAM